MKKFALVFPGQGSQYVGMGKKLCEQYSVASQLFEEAGDMLGFDLKKLCFEGDLVELTKTINAQPAILTTSVAAYKVFEEEINAKPAFAAGHSLGEYSALVCSGAISFADAVKIVRERGRFMQEATSDGIGAMAAIMGINKEIVENECKLISAEGNVVVVSNYNAPIQTVISGYKDAVIKASEKLKEQGATYQLLKVSAPFHCPLMQQASENLKNVLMQYQYNNILFPVLSNVTAKPYEGTDRIVDNLIAQMVAPVQWVNTMNYFKDAGIDTIIEMGPKSVLKNLTRRNQPDINGYAYDQEKDVEELKEMLGGEYNRINDPDVTVVTRCMAVAVCTRNRNWNNEEYIKGVSEPYNEIQRMQEEIEKSGEKPTVDQMKMALNMLKLVFKTKQTPMEEQTARFEQILVETGTKNIFQDFSIID